MTVTAKDLRFNVSFLFDVLSKGEDVTITHRGKPKAKLISYDDNEQMHKEDALFGLWSDQKNDVDSIVQNMRKRREF
jgi:prevent-host-death family protein